MTLLIAAQRCWSNMFRTRRKKLIGEWASEGRRRARVVLVYIRRVTFAVRSGGPPHFSSLTEGAFAGCIGLHGAKRSAVAELASHERQMGVLNSHVLCDKDNNRYLGFAPISFSNKTSKARSVFVRQRKEVTGAIKLRTLGPSTWACPSLCHSCDHETEVNSEGQR